MAESLFPDKTVNYRVYDDGEALLGTATVELPEIAYMTDTLSGAGIAGEVETSVLGHTQAMSATINWTTVQDKAVNFLSNNPRTLTFRSSQQYYDSANGNLVTKPLKIVMKCLSKSMALGSLEPGVKTDSSSVVEVTYLKVELDGKQLCEIDKFNYICTIGDDDLLASVRADLGL